MPAAAVHSFRYIGLIMQQLCGLLKSWVIHASVSFRVATSPFRNR